MVELYGLKPSKRSGQNFLKHEAVAAAFVDSALALDLSNSSAVVEIGPGFGAITQVLCARFARVLAIERDPRLIKIWQSRLQVPKNLQLNHGDAASFDFAKCAKELGSRLTIFGNLPFNVSTQILLRLYHEWPHIRYAHLTFQKEVALRLCAKPGTKDYGSLTLQTQIYADCEQKLFISRKEFYPEPKVDSLVVGLSFLSQPRIPIEDLAEFVHFIRQLFLFRRKTLLNGLKLAKQYARWLPLAKEFLQKLPYKDNSRVETLDLTTLYGLYCHCQLRNE